MKSFRLLTAGLFALLVFAGGLVPSSALAMKNEPDGFRGMHWGTDISTLPDMKKTGEDPPLDIYERQNDRLKIGEATLSHITYSAYRGRLCRVLIGFKADTNFLRLKETLFELYGKGRSYDAYDDRYVWVGKHVVVTLDYNDLLKEGTILYTYKPIAEEVSRNEKQRAKDAAKDL
jgi:hypothetical protein